MKKTMDDLITGIKELVEENETLKTNLENYKQICEKLKLRESLYQSELQNTKNKLQKLYQAIDITPHSRDTEYGIKYYGDLPINEEVS